LGQIFFSPFGKKGRATMDLIGVSWVHWLLYLSCAPS
jgi:hypothetical protein